MSKPTADVNNPSYQANMTGEGFSTVDDTLAPTPEFPRGDYPESDFNVRTGEDTAQFGTNDSTIDDDAMSPVNIPLSSPDYGLPAMGAPDDGWGPYGEDAPTGLPPGSYRGHVMMHEPACDPDSRYTMGRGENV